MYKESCVYICLFICRVESCRSNHTELIGKIRRKDSMVRKRNRNGKRTEEHVGISYRTGATTHDVFFMLPIQNVIKQTSNDIRSNRLKSSSM